MSASITLRADERKALLDIYRHNGDPAIRLRAHIVLLLAAGHPWALIEAVLFTSSSTIARWQQRFRQGGMDALEGETPGRRPRLGWPGVQQICTWVTQHSPRAFGFLRSRWTCAVLVLVLLHVRHLSVSRETVRRWLHQGNLVWRRPRPVLRPRDPQRAAQLRALRRLLRQLPDDEVAVFQDEVDITTNPKIGSMGMVRGQQATVETPGSNDKCYLAGSMNWRTGRLIRTVGAKRDGELFVRHLDDLWRAYRRIHVICDNARFHQAATCRKVQECLHRWGHRIRLHYLPKYAPETNPIERVRWHLHAEITRNHRCRTREELLDLVFQWLESRSPFEIEGSVYPKPRVA